MPKTTDKLWNRAYDLHAGWPNNEANVSAMTLELRSCDGPIEEVALLRAYVAYHFPCAVTYDIDIESELQTVLKINPKSTTARLYLAHHYYDSGNYLESLAHLGQINREEYEAVGQRWRSLKIQEMSLAARIHLASDAVSADDVVEFANELMAAGVEDAAVPSELVDSLLANKASLKQAWTLPVLRGVVSRVRDAIDRIANMSVLKEKTDMINA